MEMSRPMRPVTERQITRSRLRGLSENAPVTLKKLMIENTVVFGVTHK